MTSTEAAPHRRPTDADPPITLQQRRFARRDNRALMSQNNSPSERIWDELDPEEQTGLLEAYGYWLDRLPPTCSLETKEARFQTWLREQGVIYEPKR